MALCFTSFVLLPVSHHVFLNLLMKMACVDVSIFNKPLLKGD